MLIPLVDPPVIDMLFKTPENPPALALVPTSNPPSPSKYALAEAVYCLYLR